MLKQLKICCNKNNSLTNFTFYRNRLNEQQCSTFVQLTTFVHYKIETDICDFAAPAFALKKTTTFKCAQKMSC